MSRSAHHHNTAVSLFLAALVLVVVPSPAVAQALGARGGVSIDPDQFYVGAHYETGALVERLHFKPNLEVGFGDDLMHLGLNFEFIYKVPVSSVWSLYAGGGPAINIYTFDDDDGDDSSTGGGLNLLFGAEAANGLFFEVKIGAIDSPDFKFGVGYTFR